MMVVFRDRLSLFNVPVFLLGGLKHLCETKEPHKHTPKTTKHFLFPVQLKVLFRLILKHKYRLKPAAGGLIVSKD